MYNAENIIDLCKCKFSKLLGDQASPSTCGCFPTFSDLSTRHKVAVQIKSLNKKLDDVARKGIFSTFVNIKSDGQVPTVSNGSSSSKLVDPDLVGKEIVYATKELVEEIVRNKERKIHKIAIVGMGGVGKTTLAQKVFNELKIQSSFRSRVWSCVSQNYSAVVLLKKILKELKVRKVSYEQCDNIGELQDLLADAVREKSLFLILDDVWKSTVWIDILRTPLDAASNLTVLVTIRDRDIAAIIGADHVHESELMSMESGLELLRKFSYVKEEDFPDLRKIGTQIVKKCGNLPLTIRAIAGVLATKRPDHREWEKILQRDAWSLSTLPEQVRGAIYLSYDNLPDHLKQCFIYCSLYEEDRVMLRDDLVSFWVAEGFIEEKEGQFAEATAEDYYYELIRKSLLQPDPLHFDLSKCKLHDIFRTLGQHLSKGESYSGDPQRCEIGLSKLQRATIIIEEEDTVTLGSKGEHLRLRTLVSDSPLKLHNSFFRTTPYLRVLSLNWEGITSVSSSIGHLVHLRLLDFDHTSITKLPEEIGSLVSLEILNLQNCKCLHALPKGITRLVSLRRLGLCDTPINQVPRGIRRLAFLNNLEGYPVGNGSGSAKMQDGWELEELVVLMRLRRLDMNKLERAALRGGAELLKDKGHLEFLALCCTNQQYTEEDIGKIENVFEELFPPENLEILCFRGFFGRKYPTWLGPSLSSVKSLTLEMCISWERLPPLGQLLNLRYLKIKGASAVTRIGSELFGRGAADSATVVFPKLETLVIEDMPNWKEWSFTEEAEEDAEEEGRERATTNQGGAALSPTLQLPPHLHLLSITHCPKLRTLPSQLAEVTSLQKLRIRKADNLKAVEDLPLLSHELAIHSCRGLERVSNLPLIRELKVSECAALSCVENCDSLQQLRLSDELWEPHPQWVTEFQNRRLQLHEDDLYTMRDD